MNDTTDTTAQKYLDAHHDQWDLTLTKAADIGVCLEEVGIVHFLPSMPDYASNCMIAASAMQKQFSDGPSPHLGPSDLLVATDAGTSCMFPMESMPLLLNAMGLPGLVDFVTSMSPDKMPAIILGVAMDEAFTGCHIIEIYRPGREPAVATEQPS